MDRKTLEDLGLSKEVIDKIMAENGKSINDLKKQAEELKIANENAMKELQNKYDGLTKDFDEYKKSKMSDEERAKAKQVEDQQLLESAKKAKSDYENLIKVTKVKSILSPVLSAEEVDSLAGTLIGSTEEESITKATNFVNLIKAKQETAAKKAVENAASKMDKPNPSNPDNDRGNKAPYTPNVIW